MSKRRISDRLEVQFFGKREPTRRDALLNLAGALNLLAEALPLALFTIGQQPLDVQCGFWLTFAEFNRHTDLTLGDNESLSRDAIDAKLSRWAEDAGLRALGEKGDLDTEEENPS